MENLTVRELIRFLLSFNMDAKVYISVKDKDIPMKIPFIHWSGLEDCDDTRKITNEVVFHVNFKSTDK